MNALVISEIYLSQRRTIEHLHNLLERSFLELDDLKYTVAKNILYTYMFRLGDLEYEVNDTIMSMSRARRKLEILQAKRNLQEEIKHQEIEIILDLEFLKYQEQLETLREQILDSITYQKSPCLTTEEVEEIKKLYRKIMKALHPDLNLNLNCKQREMFHQAVKCYERNDLSGIRIIAALAEEREVDVGLDPESEIGRLGQLLESVKREIGEVKVNFPFNLQDYIVSEETIQTRRIELTEIIARYREFEEYYQQKILEVLNL